MERMHVQTINSESQGYRSMSAQAFAEGDGAERLLSPAPVLPEQLSFRPAGSAHPASGVRALLWAMLEDAISCVQQQALKPSRRHQRLAREAEQWILADNTTWVFSFLNVCAALGLEPDYLRAKLDQWVKRWARPTQRAASKFDAQETFKLAA